MNAQTPKVGQEMTINGKTLVVTGRDGAALIVMGTERNGAIREYRLTVDGRLERIN